MKINLAFPDMSESLNTLFSSALPVASILKIYLWEYLACSDTNPDSESHRYLSSPSPSDSLRLKF